MHASDNTRNCLRKKLFETQLEEACMQCLPKMPNLENVEATCQITASLPARLARLSNDGARCVEVLNGGCSKSKDGSKASKRPAIDERALHQNQRLCPQDQVSAAMKISILQERQHPGPPWTTHILRMACPETFKTGNTHPLRQP